MEALGDLLRKFWTWKEIPRDLSETHSPASSANAAAKNQGIGMFIWTTSDTNFQVSLTPLQPEANTDFFFHWRGDVGGKAVGSKQ